MSGGWCSDDRVSSTAVLNGGMLLVTKMACRRGCCHMTTRMEMSLDGGVSACRFYVGSSLFKDTLARDGGYKLENDSAAADTNDALAEARSKLLAINPALQKAWSQPARHEMRIDDGWHESQPLSFVDIKLVNESHEPFAGEAFKLTLPDGRIVQGVLSDQGAVRVDDAPAGRCTVEFPRLGMRCGV